MFLVFGVILIQTTHIIIITTSAYIFQLSAKIVNVIYAISACVVTSRSQDNSINLIYTASAN
jgi:hypothetical protein